MSDVMSAPVLTAGGTTRSQRSAVAWSKPRSDRSSSSTATTPVGILTERDLIRFAASGARPRPTTVAEWMTADPDTVEPDAGVAEAYQRLSDKGYRHFPVVEDGALVGVVSRCVTCSRSPPSSRSPTPARSRRRPGLEGVIVAETTVGDVRGLEGFYHYRQYSAVDLAAALSLEDAWYLLFEGALPTASERERLPRRDPPLAGHPRRGHGDAPRHRPGVRARSWRGCGPRCRFVGATSDMQPDARHRPRRRDAPTRCDLRRGAHPDHGDVPAALRAMEPIAALGTTWATGPTTSG